MRSDARRAKRSMSLIAGRIVGLIRPYSTSTIRLIRMNSQREQQHERLDHRIVAHVDGIDQQAAEARPVEHLLDDDRAAEQEAELQAHHRHHRNQRVAQPVLDDDAALVKPLARAVRM